MGQVPRPGGPLNTQTVDNQGRVLYRVDSGPLGPLSNEEATALADRIFRQYTDIPTASIEYVNAGRILNPSTGESHRRDGVKLRRIPERYKPHVSKPYHL